MNRYVRIILFFVSFLIVHRSYCQDVKSNQRKKELEGQKKKLQEENQQLKEYIQNLKNRIENVVNCISV